MAYELHPLCTLFPRLAGAEFEALRDDIRANGLRAPIVLHDGMILDGGNRYRACLEAGVVPTFAPFAGGNLVAFVLSANLHRRHMSAGQQAAIVASAQDWAMAQPASRPEKAGNVAGLSTVADRAAQSGASERTQRMADKVAKANPDLAKQVAHGEVSLPKAVAQVEQRPPKPDEANGQSKQQPATPSLNGVLAELEDLRERFAEQGKNLADTIADNESMARVFEADDRIGVALAEAKRYRELNRVLEERLRGSMNSENAAKRSAKSWQAKFEKLEREVKKAANDGIDSAAGF